MSEVQIRPLDPSDAGASVELLLATFPEDPWARWVFAAKEPGYLERLRGYFEVGHAWHTEAGFPVLAAYAEDGLAGVSYVMEPGIDVSEEAAAALLPRLRAACGAESTERFTRCNEAGQAEMPEVEAHCIAVLGVRRDLQGQGIGGRLVRRTGADAERAPGSGGVVLETGNPRNLPFYAAHGFETVARVAFPGFDNWVLFRPDPRRND